MNIGTPRIAFYFSNTSDKFCFLKGVNRKQQTMYNSYCLKENGSIIYKKAEELLNINYTKFIYSNDNMYNDLIDKIYKYFYINNKMICVNKYNKYNKLCSGYFTSFIIPEIGQTYKKDNFNNFS